MVDKKLETLAYRLRDLSTLRNLFSELNFDFADKPVNKDNWNDEQKKIVQEAKIIASKDDYQIYYIQTNTDLLKEWNGVSSKIIKDNNGLCMICSHNPSGFKWVFSSLSKEFSKSFTETRHVPIDINPDVGVPNTFVDFLEKIKVGKDSTSTSIASQISDAFDSFAIRIHDELTENVFDALKVLSEGIIGDKNNNLSLTDETLEEIREPIFILLYRIIFILYAEDRGIFPVEDPIYHKKFGIKWLKEEWLLKSFDPKKLGDYEVQKRLKNLFRLIEVGSEELDYDKEEFFMRSYYGRIFDRRINSELENWKIPNSNFLETLSLLTRTKDKKGNYFFLDYSALETRHLGSIYEHLLEFHLNVKNKQIAELPNPKERKLSGSYYTPQDVVNYIIKNTVEPIIDKIIKETNDKHEQKEKILSLKILDPAMGSGHFLVSVMNFVAKKICEVEDDLSESNIIERKRDVVRKCLYGVDLNPLAVDLTKVSLWLETLASEKPLSFLSAHIKCGNSLVGSQIDRLFEKQMTLDEAQKGREHFKKSVKDFLMFENLEDDSSSAVKAKLEKYQKIRSQGTIFYDLKFLLNCKSAEMFGAKVPALGDYRSKIGENSLDFYTNKSLQKVKELSEKHIMFHWEIEFPEIFYDEKGNKKINYGFDIILANPPYIEKSKLGYPTSFLETDSCGNSYAYFFEIAIKMLRKDGGIGFIVPISSVCTDRMNPLQHVLRSQCEQLLISNFDDRPAKLFPSLEHCRSSIIIGTKIKTAKNRTIKTTKYNRWYSDERGKLFNDLKYVECSDLVKDGIIPKIGTQIEKNLLNKISLSPKLETFLEKKSKYVAWYHNAPQYWIRVMDFVPLFNSKSGKISSHVKPIYIKNQAHSKIIIAVLNSSLFYWYFVTSSNCRDLTFREIKNFGIELDNMTKASQTKLQKLCSELMIDYKKYSKTKIIESKRTGKVSYQEFFPSNSKPIIDKIDDVLAIHFGFSEEELSHIKNYDLQFRMGK